MRQYIHGWAVWLECLLLARRKKHGAGKQRLTHAIKTANAARFIAWGQHHQN